MAGFILKSLPSMGFGSMAVELRRAVGLPEARADGDPNAEVVGFVPKQFRHCTEYFWSCSPYFTFYTERSLARAD